MITVPVGGSPFPVNVINVLGAFTKSYFDDIDPSGDTIVVKRPVSISDSDQTIGISPVEWQPRRPVEMGYKSNPNEPSVQGYPIMLQALINDANEDVAIARHCVFSTMLRQMLYREPVLMGALTQLKAESLGIRETVSRMEIRSQSFLATKARASFLYMSVIEFYVETQIAQI